MFRSASSPGPSMFGAPRPARSRSGLSQRVAELPPDPERLREMTEGLDIAHLGQREAQLVEHPGFTEPVLALAGAVRGHPVDGHAVRPAIPPVEHREQGRRQPPGDIVQTRRDGLAGGGSDLPFHLRTRPRPLPCRRSECGVASSRPVHARLGNGAARLCWRRLARYPSTSAAAWRPPRPARRPTPPPARARWHRPGAGRGSGTSLARGLQQVGVDQRLERVGDVVFRRPDQG